MTKPLQDSELNRSCYGRFFIDSYVALMNPKMVRALMAEMVIVTAEHCFNRDAFCYEAYSDLFDPSDPGVSAPAYRIEPDGWSKSKPMAWSAPASESRNNSLNQRRCNGS